VKRFGGIAGIIKIFTLALRASGVILPPRYETCQAKWRFEEGSSELARRKDHKLRKRFTPN
jgi:hypothetical protein